MARSNGPPHILQKKSIDNGDISPPSGQPAGNEVPRTSELERIAVIRERCAIVEQLLPPGFAENLIEQGISASEASELICRAIADRSVAAAADLLEAGPQKDQSRWEDPDVGLELCATCLPISDSSWFSEWSPSGRHLITYYFPCPECREIQPYLVSADSFSGSPPLTELQICDKCGHEGTAYVEGETGLVEDCRISLFARELEREKLKSERSGDIYGWLLNCLVSNFFEICVLDWECGGPVPPSIDHLEIEAFTRSYAPTFAELAMLRDQEPFFLEILKTRIELRMEKLVELAVKLPNDSRTAQAYEQMVDSMFTNPLQAGEISTEYMRRRPRRIWAELGKDCLRSVCALMRWHHVFVSETRRLLGEVNEGVPGHKSNRRASYFSIIREARNGNLDAFAKLVSWDRIWLTCPWVIKLIKENAYHMEFITALSNSCGNKNPGCALSRQENESQRQGKEELQFIHDMFLAHATPRGTLKVLRRYLEDAQSFGDSYADRNTDNLRKFVKRHILK